MYRLKERLGKDKFNWALFFCLIAQITLIIFCNFALSERNIDPDSAKIFRHVIELWRKKTLVMPDWKYGTTTMVIDSSALFAVPLFGILGNIYYAFALSNVILMFILLWTISQIFKGEKIAYFLVCANVIFIPYGIGQLQYFNMMFFNYSGYIIKVMLPLMLVAILVQAEKEEKLKFSQIIFILLYFFLLIICCFSSGLYVFCCGLFPALAGYIVLKFYNLEKISLNHAKWILGTFLGIGIGFILNLRWGSTSVGDAMTLCNAYDLKDNISACILGIFGLFGGITYESIPVLSYTGIKILVHFCFVIIVIICGITVGVKMYRHQASMEQALLLIIFIWNFFVLCVTNTRLDGTFAVHYRYHLIGAVPLLCVAGKIAAVWYEKIKEKWYLAGIYLLTLWIFIFTPYIDVFRMQYNNDLSKAICEYAIENDIKKVYMLDMPYEAEVCRLLDYETAEYLCVNSDVESVYVVDYYKAYEDEPIEFENAVLVGSGDSAKDTMNIFGHEYKRIDVVEGLGIYK